MPQYGWVLDLQRCIGCRTCTVSCQSELNTLELQTSKANLSYRWVVEQNGGTYPNVRRQFVTMSCMHCEDPPCIRSCPVRAISKREQDGIVLIDQELCIGCRYCIQACPYGAPQFNENTQRVEKCTFCVHRTDASVGLNPACVDTCVGRALSWGQDVAVPGNEPEGFADRRYSNPSIRFTSIRF